MKADINIRVATPSDFKIKLKTKEGYELRRNFLFFLYNQANSTMNGPYILNHEMDLKLLNTYLENRIVYVCESHESQIPDNWHPIPLQHDDEYDKSTVC